MTSLIQVFSDPASAEISEHFLSQVCWLDPLCVPAQYTVHTQTLLTLFPAGDGWLGLFGEAVYLTKITGQGGKHVGLVSCFTFTILDVLGSLKVEYRTEHCVRTGVFWLFQVLLLQSLSDACSNLQRWMGSLLELFFWLKTLLSDYKRRFFCLLLGCSLRPSCLTKMGYHFWEVTIHNVWHFWLFTGSIEE